MFNILIVAGNYIDHNIKNIFASLFLKYKLENTYENALIFRTMEYLEEVAIQAARQLATGELKVSREKKGLVDKILNFGLRYESVRNQIFGKAKAAVMKQTGGLYPAPLKVQMNF